MSGITLETLRAVRDYLYSLPPVIHTLWFVDNYHAYWQYRSVIGYAFRMDVPQAVEWYALFDRGEPRPDFCTTSGIWARYTDGNDRQLTAAEFAALIEVVRLWGQMWKL